MQRNPAPPEGAPSRGPGLGRLVFDDLRHGDLRSKLRQDFRDLYSFYIDEDRRTRLAKMGRVKRWIYVVGWLGKSMFLKLNPARRVLVLIGMVLLFFARLMLEKGGAEHGVQVDVDFHMVGGVILLLVLMLELKDKLLAHDELRTGRVVQLALAPSERPLLAGWDMFTLTRPANEVGGDLVDHLPVREGRLGVALGDVAGKGLGAALLMAKLQATLRAFAPDLASLGELGARVNRILCRDGLPNRFATLVYAELAPDSGAVRLVNAGHLPPAVLRADGVDLLPAEALPLGVRADENYVEQRVELAAGDALFVYSDGLSEARNARGEYFGEVRLSSVLPQLRGLSAEAATQRLVNEVEAFAGEERLGDDLSLVYLLRLPQPTESAA